MSYCEWVTSTKALGDHSFTHSFLNAFFGLIHSSIHSFIHAFILSFNHSLIHSILHLFIHLFFHWFVRSSIHSFIDSFVRSFIPLSSFVIFWTIYLFIHDLSIPGEMPIHSLHVSEPNPGQHDGDQARYGGRPQLLQGVQTHWPCTHQLYLTGHVVPIRALL